MNADRLLTHYERIADAPDAIVRLRRFILDLAVRGKLMKQDPADEPATELLQRIAREKARLVVAWKFKTFNGDHLGDDAHCPFLVPANWTWCYLDDLAAIARGGSPRPIKSYLTEDPSGIPWIKIGDSVRGSIYINNTKERIRPEGLTKSRFVYPGDLLLSNSMSFGYPYITNIEGCIHDGWLVIRTPETLVDKLYLHTLFLSSHAKQIFSDSASGAVVRNLNADKARLLSVPLPPLAEQHRIVAKIDELMALCERLEAARAERETKRDRLAAASLARLNAPDLDSTTFRNYVAFVLENLPPLTTRLDQIKALRQTILKLAVRGKLVKQDPADEPASVLLKRIAEEKVRLMKVGEIKTTKAPIPVAIYAPFSLPIGWAWCTLGEICSKTGSGSTPRGGKNAYRQDGIAFLRSQNIYDSGLRVDDVAYIDTATHKKMSGTAVRPADLLLNITGGSMGRCCRVPDQFCEANVSQHVAIIRVAINGLQDFVHLLIRSPFFQSFIFDEQTGAGRGGLPKNKMDRIPIALPPLAEQHRIVAKVDELMTLCDPLGASLASGDDTRCRLLDALLHEVLSPVADQ